MVLSDTLMVLGPWGPCESGEGPWIPWTHFLTHLKHASSFSEIWQVLPKTQGHKQWTWAPLPSPLVSSPSRWHPWPSAPFLEPDLFLSLWTVALEIEVREREDPHILEPATDDGATARACLVCVPVLGSMLVLTPSRRPLGLRPSAKTPARGSRRPCRRLRLHDCQRVIITMVLAELQKNKISLVFKCLSNVSLIFEV